MELNELNEIIKSITGNMVSEDEAKRLMMNAPEVVSNNMMNDIGSNIGEEEANRINAMSKSFGLLNTDNTTTEGEVYGTRNGVGGNINTYLKQLGLSGGAGADYLPNNQNKINPYAFMKQQIGPNSIEAMISENEGARYTANTPNARASYTPDNRTLSAEALFKILGGQGAVGLNISDRERDRLRGGVNVGYTRNF